jgi:hypothetical protein
VLDGARLRFEQARLVRLANRHLPFRSACQERELQYAHLAFETAHGVGAGAEDNGHGRGALLRPCDVRHDRCRSEALDDGVEIHEDLSPISDRGNLAEAHGLADCCAASVRLCSRGLESNKSCIHGGLLRF